MTASRYDMGSTAPTGRARRGPTAAEIAAYVRAGSTAPDGWRIGVELEELLLDRRGRRASYHRVASAVGRATRRLGGEPQYEDGQIVGGSSRRGGISVEPGGQMEWSSPPAASLTELHEGVRRWLAIQESVLREGGMHPHFRAYAGNAINATHRPGKRRYRGMRRHYRSVAARTLPAMEKTAGVHLSFDYADDRDWSEKFRAMLWAAPLAAALFANSPGVWRGVSMRAVRPWLWRRFDPVRTRLPRAAFRPGFGVDAYAAWAASRPPLLPRGSRDGSDDAARAADARLGELFPLVRSKQVLEVRSMDRVQADDLPAMTGFWTGLLYDRKALAEWADALPPSGDRSVWERWLYQACRRGPAVRGELRRLLLLSARLAGEGLARRGRDPQAARCLERLEQLTPR
ncbi:glutamate-cysteine ligase family protein [Botrimarina sp.]|uniref:glutamate-cysteine ligase family protein n=1 Tax=Botrimarina sp. TaxID=2795802 RepID=UPI0032EF097F